LVRVESGGMLAGARWEHARFARWRQDRIGERTSHRAGYPFAGLGTYGHFYVVGRRAAGDLAADSFSYQLLAAQLSL
jgi:hypothetical protein